MWKHFIKWGFLGTCPHFETPTSPFSLPLFSCWVLLLCFIIYIPEHLLKEIAEFLPAIELDINWNTHTHTPHVCTHARTHACMLTHMHTHTYHHHLVSRQIAISSLLLLWWKKALTGNLSLVSYPLFLKPRAKFSPLEVGCAVFEALGYSVTKPFLVECGRGEIRARENPEKTA